jgi:hypothetical protein
VSALEAIPVTGGLVRSAPVEEVLESQRQYRDLCDRLLDANDYTSIDNRPVRNKSGWRKLALAFNVSDTVISKEIHRDDRGWVTSAEFMVRAWTPSGRTMEGYGACDIHDRCCPGEGVCTRWLTYPDTGRRTGHTHCPSDCDGRHAFTSPSHDIPSTAMTRALNRAFSDLFGMGEASAEETRARGPGKADHDTGEVHGSRRQAGASDTRRPAGGETPPPVDPRPAQDAQVDRIVALYDELEIPIPAEEIGKTWTFPEARAKINELEQLRGEMHDARTAEAATPGPPPGPGGSGDEPF